MKEKTITLDQLVRWVGAGLLVLGILLLVNYLSKVLLPFFVAWLLAYLLYPMVKFVQYKLHVGNRALSIVITLVFVIALLAGVIYMIIPPMIEQFEKLGSLATDYIQKEAHIRDTHPAFPPCSGYPRRAIPPPFPRPRRGWGRPWSRPCIFPGRRASCPHRACRIPRIPGW